MCEMTAPAAELRDRPSGTGRLAIWRWHFYAGLFVAPVLLVMAVTGALTLFDREIDELFYPDLVVVTPLAEAPLSLARQEALALAAVPGGALRSYAAPETAAHSAVFTVARPDGGGELVFVDPWRGVLGSMDQDRRLMIVIVALHSSLLAGRAGNILVELVACWTLILVVTGLALWWPKRWRMPGILIPRLDGGTRQALRDLHAIPGALFAAATLFLVATGLPWSGVWGGGLSRVAQANPTLFGPAPTVGGPTLPLSKAHAHHTSNSQALPWVMRHHPVAAGTLSDRPLDLAGAFGLARSAGLSTSWLLIVYPSGDGLFTAVQRSNRAEGQRVTHMDAGTGEIISDVAFRDYSPLGKAVEWGVNTHMGRQFGLVNQLLGLGACIAIIGSVFTGLWMWWRRRPQGALGVPAGSRQASLPPALSATLIGLVIALPLAGLSLLAMLLLDRGVRMVRARQWA
jgi:uncharacterized iron-regulated membrane protein